MKKCLKKENFEIYHILKGKKINGVHTGIEGDVSGIWGDVSGIWGDVSGIWGGVDDAELTDDERRAGIDVSQLLKDKN